MSRKLVELLIDEEQEEFGVQAISLVEFPAFEEDANFVFFGKDSKLTLAKIDEDKRLLVGCALIPDKKIPRYDQEAGEEYEVYFTKETIKKASELFLKYNKQNEHTLEHQKEITGLSVVESWIVDDDKHDKSRLFGFSVPIGSWMVSIKVGNDEIWKEIKAKSIKGFSIEGFFIDKVENMQLQKRDLKKQCEELDPYTMGKIKELLLDNDLIPVTTLDGEPVFKSKEEAEMYGVLEYSCEGSHSHEIGGQVLWMACENMGEVMAKMKKKRKKKWRYSGEKWLKAIERTKERLLARYPWDKCIRDQKRCGYSEDSAAKICGYIKSKYGG